MDFDYFYGEQSDQYAFYRIPKILIVEDYFQNLSTSAKLLYGLLLDRVSLSANSKWFDDQGRVYIIYTLKSIQRDMHCGDRKATRLLQELEKWGLIERKSQGQGKPAIIYVKNFCGVWSKERFLSRQNDDSRTVKMTSQESSEQRCNNTNINNTDYIDTYPIQSVEWDRDKRDFYIRFFNQQLDMEILRERYPLDQEQLEAIFSLIIDTVCSKRRVIRIAGDDKPVEVVWEQFMKLDSSHIEYVLDCLHSSASKVRNIKQYMLAALYNAPITIKNYYQAMVNHDMATTDYSKRTQNGGNNNV